MTQVTTKSSGRSRSRSSIIIAFLIGMGVGAAIGITGYLLVFSGSGEASEDVRNVAPTLSLGGNSSSSDSSSDGDSSDGDTDTDTSDNDGAALPRGIRVAMAGGQTISQADATAAADSNIDQNDNNDENDNSDVTATPTPEPGDPIGFSRALYRIDPDESEVRFILQEDLRGERIDVVGVTDQIGGDFIVDFSAPGASQVGEILINARTLVTDNDFRNRAIRSSILRSADDAFEFIRFVPTSIDGLPDEQQLREFESFDFTITGELTIVEVTQEVTFDVSGRIGEAGETLIGTATTQILWPDYNLSIPSVPGVANITDDVTLELDFSADLVESQTEDDLMDDNAAASGEAIDLSRGLYRIDPEQSEASFTLQEDLRGQTIDVIGTTDQVGGDIIVDFDAPDASEVGEILINARTLVTDNDFRNRAIRSNILRSAEDDYEFVSFVASSIEGLSSQGPVNADETYEFTMTGDLTIVEVTSEVTFDVSAILDADGQTLTGTATTVISWRDYNLSIPSAPGVANITDDVTLTIRFVAPLVDSE